VVVRYLDRFIAHPYNTSPPNPVMGCSESIRKEGEEYMPAVPKRKISKTRGRNRRSHWKAKAARLVTCLQCGAPVRPHHVCLSCGTYRGIEVIEIEEE